MVAIRRYAASRRKARSEKQPAAVANPFRIGEHVSGEHFANRTAEIARIRSAMLEPSAMLVYGPRRMGKSSSIRAAADVARKGTPKPIIVSADIATATSLFDVAARLLRSMYVETRPMRLRFEELLGALAPRISLTFNEQSGAPVITFGTERRTATEADKRRTLEVVFERLLELRRKSRRQVAIVLDEFQVIRALGGESGEWHLRDVIQRNGDLSVICAGSEETLIREMIGPKRAFYKMFELLYMGPMNEQRFAGWIEERLKRAAKLEGEVGLEIVRLSGPRTQDVIQVARQLFFRGVGSKQPLRPADVREAIEDLVDSEAPLIRTLWGELSPHQQDVLRVVALGVDQIFSAEVRDRYALPAGSTIQKALDALTTRSVLVREEGGRIRFDSAFVRRWVEREVAPDVGIAAAGFGDSPEESD
jgi:hypothetical protein